MTAPSVEVRLLSRGEHQGPASFAGAQTVVGAFHYLQKPVDPRAMPEAWGIYLSSTVPGELAGYLVVGRPEATRCYPWYGSIDDVGSGRASCTRWQVLNLARVYIFPRFQQGGVYHWPELLPGFTDRRGRWRSALGSAALRALTAVVGAQYLLRRPPCFLEEPYEVRWLLSYCDTRIHRGALYAGAGWELYRTNAEGVQTWRTPLPALAPDEDAAVRAAAAVHPRSRLHRERRSQLALEV
ncbi:MAG: hypothetical protein AB1941_10015 [Gemmatimonadota bacterium]